MKMYADRVSFPIHNVLIRKVSVRGPPEVPFLDAIHQAIDSMPVKMGRGSRVARTENKLLEVHRGGVNEGRDGSLFIQVPLSP